MKPEKVFEGGHAPNTQESYSQTNSEKRCQKSPKETPGHLPASASGNGQDEEEKVDILSFKRGMYEISRPQFFKKPVLVFRMSPSVDRFGP